MTTPLGIVAQPCVKADASFVAAMKLAAPAQLSVTNKLIGVHFIQSMPRYITNLAKPTEWVSNGSVHKLCILKKPKPQLLKFWVTGHVSAQYLGAMKNYQSTYAIDLQVTDDIMRGVHAFFETGPQKAKTYSYQSPLQLKAAFAAVKQEANQLGQVGLPGVELPLDEISDYLLIFDGSNLTKDSDESPGGLSLSHLEDKSFVAVELWASAYNIKDNAGYRLTFSKIYTLNSKSAWEEEVEYKGCGPIAIANVNKRSKKFYTEEDDD